MGETLDIQTKNNDEIGIRRIDWPCFFRFCPLFL